MYLGLVINVATFYEESNPPIWGFPEDVDYEDLRTFLEKEFPFSISFHSFLSAAFNEKISGVNLFFLPDEAEILNQFSPASVGYTWRLTELTMPIVTTQIEKVIVGE